MILNEDIILDISGFKPLSSQNARRLDSIAEALREEYVELINQISILNSDRIDWWVMPLATRNTFSHSFFIDCCRAKMLDELLAGPQGLITVVVGSPGMARVARNLIRQRDSRCRIQFDRGRYLRRELSRRSKNFFGAVFQSLSQWVFANLMAKDIKCNQSQSLILVDTFLYSNSFRGGKFHDRHFPGIEIELDHDEQDLIYYFPTFYGIRNFAKTFRQLKLQSAKFLFKEHYLCISDYFFALGHGLRIRNLKPKIPLVLGGMDVSPIADDNMGAYSSPASAVEALLKYRAIDRMNQAGVRLRRVIDWFENQDIDRGANAGFRRFYPDCPVIGYIGYVPSGHYHLCMKPTATELSAAILPTKITVMGREFVESLREFAPGLNVDVAPALRYRHLYLPQPRFTGAMKFEILVALPVVRSEALAIVTAVRSAIPEVVASKQVVLKVIIKPHPAMINLPQELSWNPDNPEVCVEWSNNRLDQLLASANVMISSASSSCFEALTLGVPVVVMGNLSGLTYVSIPRGVSRELWQLCYPGESLYVAIEQVRRGWSTALSTGANPVTDFLEMYVEPVTRAGIRELVLGTST